MQSVAFGGPDGSVLVEFEDRVGDGLLVEWSGERRESLEAAATRLAEKYLDAVVRGLADS